MIFPENSGGREPADSRFSAVRQEQGCQDMTAAKGEDGNAAVPTGKDSFIPSDRTEAYYQSRPCKALVGLAAAILDAYLAEHSGRA